jgi:uncharacterized membrane protein YhaH (DUF805 family)
MSFTEALFGFNGRLGRPPFFGYCVPLLFFCVLVGAGAPVIRAETRGGGAVLGLLLLDLLVALISSPSSRVDWRSPSSACTTWASLARQPCS